MFLADRNDPVVGVAVEVGRNGEGRSDRPEEKSDDQQGGVRKDMDEMCVNEAGDHGRRLRWVHGDPTSAEVHSNASDAAEGLIWKVESIDGR